MVSGIAASLYCRDNIRPLDQLLLRSHGVRWNHVLHSDTLITRILLCFHVEDQPDVQVASVRVLKTRAKATESAVCQLILACICIYGLLQYTKKNDSVTLVASCVHNEL